MAVLCSWVVSCSVPSGLPNSQTVDGTTFSARPEELYLPPDEAGRVLGWKTRFDHAGERLYLDGRTFPNEAPGLLWTEPRWFP